MRHPYIDKTPSLPNGFNPTFRVSLGILATSLKIVSNMIHKRPTLPEIEEFNDYK